MFELVGSTRSDPIAFVPKLFDKNFQVGVVASALSVRQIPPPAAPTQSRQPFVSRSSSLSPRLGRQFGAIASAVMRPEVIYGAPLKVKTAGKLAVLGPISCHAPGACSLASIERQPLLAARVA